MPQLDYTTYSSQIFWFLICFAIIYYFNSRIILPRMREILKARQSVIDHDLSLASSIEKKTDDLTVKIEALNASANQEYQTKLDEVIKAAAKKKEQMFEDLKNQIDSKIENSRQEIKEFVANSKGKSELAIQDVAKLIKQKILN